MLDIYLQPRYWSPCQPYATGDVVMGMIAQRWQIVSMQPAPTQKHARFYTVNLHRGRNDLKLLVLDGPAVQDIFMKFDSANTEQRAL
jgi:hypothetical protein